MQSLYLETRGWLHAWRPGLKLGLVAVLGTVVFLIEQGLPRQVQAGKGFVQQEQARRGDDERQPAHVLALSLTEAADGALGPMAQAPRLQPGRGLLPRLAPRQAAHLQAQGQLFLHGRKNDLFIRVLEHHAHLGLASLGSDNVLAEYPDLTTAGHFQPAQQAKQTALARAVVTDEANALLPELERQSVKHSVLATNKRDVSQFNCVTFNHGGVHFRLSTKLWISEPCDLGRECSCAPPKTSQSRSRHLRHAGGQVSLLDTFGSLSAEAWGEGRQTTPCARLSTYGSNNAQAARWHMLKIWLEADFADPRSSQTLKR